jgi:hypothetical protein
MGLLSRIPPPKAVSCREAAAAACRETPSGVPRNPVRPHSGVPRSAPSCLWRRDARARHRSTRARREEEEEEEEVTRRSGRSYRGTPTRGGSNGVATSPECGGARVWPDSVPHVWPGLRGGARVWRRARVVCVAARVWRRARVVCVAARACGGARVWSAWRRARMAVRLCVRTVPRMCGRTCVAARACGGVSVARMWEAVARPRVPGVRARMARPRVRRTRMSGVCACLASTRVWPARAPSAYTRVRRMRVCDVCACQACARAWRPRAWTPGAHAALWPTHESRPEYLTSPARPGPARLGPEKSRTRAPSGPHTIVAHSRPGPSARPNSAVADGTVTPAWNAAAALRQRRQGRPPRLRTSRLQARERAEPAWSDTIEPAWSETVTPAWSETTTPAWSETAAEPAWSDPRGHGVIPRPESPSQGELTRSAARCGRSLRSRVCSVSGSDGGAGRRRQRRRLRRPTRCIPRPESPGWAGPDAIRRSARPSWPGPGSGVGARLAVPSNKTAV